ncbi:NAD-dependent epimerase/dehydratase family protein [Coprothermobacteraceae bacterium]|nr:NAD-dependent epimerase/dehydratase family protein [Coprothermobacteraceae bacterium]
MADQKRALVTGGAGFIGSHLTDRLLREGFRVLVVDNLTTGDSSNVNPAAEFVCMDIRSPEMKKLIAEFKPDYVFHLAAQINVRKSIAQPVEDASINVLGSLNVLQSLVETAEDVSKVKFVFSSTGGAIYGDVDVIPTPETVEPRPLSPYGIAKFAVEKYLYFFGEVHQLPWVALRYSNVYGPRQSTKGEAGVVAIFIEKMLAGETPIINGDGTQTRDFVYVQDVVEANLKAAFSHATGVYNIGTARETSVNQIFRTIAQLLGCEAQELHGPAIPGELQRSALSYDKARADLGWAPSHTLEEGLALTVQWFLEKV